MRPPSKDESRSTIDRRDDSGLDPTDSASIRSAAAAWARRWSVLLLSLGVLASVAAGWSVAGRGGYAEASSQASHADGCKPGHKRRAHGCKAPVPPPIVGKGYREVFGNEFNSLNRAVWDDHIWYDDPPERAWAPTQYVHGGILNLVSRRNDQYPGCQSNCYPMVTTTTFSSRKSFQYGYFEARMRWTKGAGSWPAFWLISTGWAKTGSCATPSGELDVMEGQGTEPTVLYGTIHKDSAGRCGGDDQNDNNYHNVGIDLTKGFHTYAALWTASKVSWYLDNRLIMSAPTYPSDNQPMFLLLQMWSGGWTRDPDATSPQELRTEVDWVRVWQR